MAALDVSSLLVVNFANISVIAVALPFVMGSALSPGARHARRALFLQGLGAMLFGVSSALSESAFLRAFSTLAISVICIAQWHMYLALQAWLGPRPLRYLMLGLCSLTPVGFFLTFGAFRWNTGVTDLMLAMESFLLAWCCLYPATALNGRWRWALALCGVALGAANGARSALALLFPDQFPSFFTAHPVNVTSLLVINVAMMMATVSILVAWRSEAEAQLRDLAVTDTLSGLRNRRGWVEQGAVLWASHARHHRMMTVLALDLDFFKRINDTDGHQVGDAVIREFGRLLGANARLGDLVARIGGEEFAVLMAGADAAAAQALDQRLREALAQCTIDGLTQPVNFSSGLAYANASVCTLETLQGHADKALYRAKSRGRARLEMAPPWTMQSHEPHAL